MPSTRSTRNRKFLILLTAIFVISIIYMGQIMRSDDSESIEQYMNRMRTMDSIKILYHKNFCECKIDDVMSIEKIEEEKSPVTFSVHILRNGNRKTFLYNMTIDEYLDMTLTCDPYKAMRRGWGQKVISLGVIDRKGINLVNLKQLSKSIKNLYPNWIIRVYHDGSIGDDEICEIECLKERGERFLDNVDFCSVNEIAKSGIGKGRLLKVFNIEPKMWKLMPLGDSFVDVFIADEVDEKFFSVNLDYNRHVMDRNGRVEDIRGFFNVRNQSQARELFKRLIN